MLRTDKMLDLIRVGVYSQMEGTFTLSGNRNDYRFRFNLNQISDMKELLARVTGKEFKNAFTVSVSSKDLFQQLFSLGFKRFRTDNWNIPNVSSMGIEGKKEYLRAVVDSIGNVDVSNENSPYVQLSSINEQGLRALQNMFGGTIDGPFEASNRFFLRWKGKASLELLEYLDWEFNNFRNRRGAELIRAVRWEDYLI